MSIGQEDLNIPGGIYVQSPALVTTTLVGNVESNASLALKKNNFISGIKFHLYRGFGEGCYCYHCYCYRGKTETTQ